jgi:hypothetical protein
MAVADLTTTDAALCFGLARRERWEVVVEQETLIAACQGTVDHLLVELGAEGTSSRDMVSPRWKMADFREASAAELTSHQIGRMSVVARPSIRKPSSRTQRRMASRITSFHSSG